MPPKSSRVFSALERLASYPPARELSGKAISELPQQFRHIVERHIHRRRESNHGIPLLGQIAPSLLCEIFDFDISFVPQKALIGWYQLYYCVIISDDLIDDPLLYKRPLLFLSGMLLQQKGLSNLFEAFGSTIQPSIHCCFADMATAASDESHFGGSADLADLKVAKRIAIGKLALLDLLAKACILSTHDRIPGDEAAIHGGIRRLAVLIQFLDDLTDCHEDAKSTHSTLVTASHQAKSPSAELMLSAGYRCTVQAALDEAKSFLDVFRDRARSERSPSFRFISGTVEVMSEMVMLLDSMRTSDRLTKGRQLKKLKQLAIQVSAGS